LIATVNPLCCAEYGAGLWTRPAVGRSLRNGFARSILSRSVRVELRSLWGFFILTKKRVRG
jgi:hypothetical protein